MAVINQQQKRYYPRQLTFGKDTSTVDVVFMHDSVDDFIKTSTHTIWSETKDGKVFPRTVECEKQHLFGDMRAQKECPYCTADFHTKMYSKYYPNSAKAFAWVIDTNAQQGERLKWIELPYSLEKALREQSQYMQVPLHRLPFKLVKNVEPSGNGTRTTYSAIINGAPLADYDKLGYAREHGFQAYPTMVGHRGAPIEQVTNADEIAKLQVQIVDSYNDFMLKVGGQQVPPFVQQVEQVQPVVQQQNPFPQQQVVQQPVQPQVVQPQVVQQPVVQQPVVQQPTVQPTVQQPVRQQTVAYTNPFPTQEQVYEPTVVVEEGEFEIPLNSEDLPF